MATITGYTKAGADARGGGGSVEISLDAYGIVGDGTTDDSAKVRQAVADVKAAGGGFVRIPPGKSVAYNPTTPLALPEGVGLRGSGWKSRLVRIGSSTGPFVTVESPQSEQSMLMDLALDCRGLGGTGAHGIHFNNPSSPDATREFSDQIYTLANVLIKQPAGWAVKLEGQTRETVLFNVQMRGCGQGGIYNDGTDTSAIACVVSGGAVAGYYESGGSNRYTGCKAFYVGPESPPAYAPATAAAGFKLENSYQATLTGCEAQDNPVGFVVTTSEQAALTGCHAASNYHVGLDLGGAGDYLTMMMVTGLRVTGNAMRWTAGMRTAGIRVARSFTGVLEAAVEGFTGSGVGVLETSAGVTTLNASRVLVASTDSTGIAYTSGGQSGAFSGGTIGTVSDVYPVQAKHVDSMAGDRAGVKFQFGSDSSRWSAVVGVAETEWADRTGVRFLVRNSATGIQSPVGITSLGYIDLGGMWLRRNGTALQVSTDSGTTWKSVTLT